MQLQQPYPARGFPPPPRARAWQSSAFVRARACISHRSVYRGPLRKRSAAVPPCRTGKFRRDYLERRPPIPNDVETYKVGDEVSHARGDLKGIPLFVWGFIPEAVPVVFSSGRRTLLGHCAAACPGATLVFVCSSLCVCVGLAGLFESHQERSFLLQSRGPPAETPAPGPGPPHQPAGAPPAQEAPPGERRLRALRERPPRR